MSHQKELEHDSSSSDLEKAIAAAFGGRSSAGTQESQPGSSTGPARYEKLDTDLPEQIGRYRIERLLGKGAFGKVYLGRDEQLERPVAIKVPHRELVASRADVDTYLAEGRMLAQLDHPHIVPVYDIGRSPEFPCFIVSKFVDGSSLSQLLRERQFTGTECARLAATVAHALHHAHQRRLIHRDIKPGNLLVDLEGKIHIADFGAALRKPGNGHGRRFVGTPAYMSPEQALAEKEIDHRTDIYGLGATLYEALTLRPPLKGRSTRETLRQITAEEPIAPRAINRHIPKDLETIVLRCLRKDPRDRYPDAKAVAVDLERFLRGEPIVARPQSTMEAIGRRAWRHRRALVVSAAMAAVVLALAIFSRAQLRAKRDLEWVQEARPRIHKAIEQQHYIAAFELVKRARRLAPGDGTIKGLARSFINTITVTTDPPGAVVSIREYRNASGKWLHLGTTPLHHIEAPSGDYRWRVEQESCGPRQFTRTIREHRTDQTFDFTLPPKEETTQGMLMLGGAFHVVGVGKCFEVKLPRFWMDQQEVSNEEYQEFVDQRGYERREYWQAPFTQDSSTTSITFEEAIARFHDRTGTPGPEGWRHGRYPSGRGKYPVTGVSWFEADAYARFRGKSLPTVYHWRGESGIEDVIITLMHNIGSEALAPVGKYPAISPNGLQDMIGNVKEWCSNLKIDTDKRFALGGSWDDPSYAFLHLPSFSPWERGTSIGFRCVRYGEGEANSELFGAVDTQYAIDHGERYPIPATEVQLYKEQLYFYDRMDLEPELSRVREDASMVVEQVTLNGTYDERFSCLLFLPKSFNRPLQAMVFGSGNGEWFLKNLRENRVEMPYLVNSGRAFVVPAKYGHFGRHPGKSPVDGKLESQQHTQRRRVRQVQDIMRVMDYLKTRDDLDGDKIGHISISSGSQKAPIVLAVEKRFRTGVMIAGGLAPYEVLASCDPFHFAPDVSVPVLMLNGETDVCYPLEDSQIPLFRLLGSPDEHKRHSIYPGGHGFYVSARQNREVEREILDWLDAYLGVPERAP